MVARGTIVRFDKFRGYGFIGPDDGGPDVFMHVNDLLSDETLIGPSTPVEFVLEDLGRGPKASQVRIVGSAANSGSSPKSTGTADGVDLADIVGDVPASSRRSPDEDDGLCDVLTAKEFTDSVTEILLHTAPSMVAADIVKVRKQFTEFARARGWVES